MDLPVAVVFAVVVSAIIAGCMNYSQAYAELERTRLDDVAERILAHPFDSKCDPLVLAPRDGAETPCFMHGRHVAIRSEAGAKVYFVNEGASLPTLVMEATADGGKLLSRDNGAAFLLDFGVRQGERSQ